MSTSVVPHDRKKHAALTFSPLTEFTFTAGMNSVPLLAFEAAKAAQCFALAFPASGSAIPHALLGLGGHNIYLDEQGHWTAPYLPLYVANYPFSLAAINGPTSSETPEVILAVDEAAPHFWQENGVPLYDEGGEPTELLRYITTMMGNQYQRHTISAPALTELQLSGVLVERNITLQKGGTTRAVQGLRVADHDTVMALPDEVLAHWALQGALELLHTHWDSLHNLNFLLDDMILREA